MQSKEILTVARILSNCPEVLRNLAEFCDLLDVPRSRSLFWLRRYNCGLLQEYDCICNILLKWQESRGQKATEEKLFQVLLDLKLINTLENLKTILTLNKMLAQPLLQEHLAEFLQLWKQFTSHSTNEVAKYSILVCQAVRLMVDKKSGKSFQEALAFLEENTTLFRSQVGIDSPQDLQLTKEKASLLYADGDLVSATGINEAVYKKQLGHTALGPEHPDTWTTARNLALCYWFNDRREDALKLLKTNLDVQTRVLPEDDKITRETLNIYMTFTKEHSLRLAENS